jgi:hypothetical protein
MAAVVAAATSGIDGNGKSTGGSGNVGAEQTGTEATEASSSPPRPGPPRAWGTPPLYTAAQGGDLPMLQVLLAHGAMVNSQSSFGQSAVFAAAENGCTKAVALLARAGADLDQPRVDIGWTPLHAAAAGGFDQTIATLLKLGATTIDATTEGGETPFLIAAEEGHGARFQTNICTRGCRWIPHMFA